jgi:hypothetical protein
VITDPILAIPDSGPVMIKFSQATSLVLALRKRIGAVKWRIQFRVWYQLSRRQKSRISLLKDVIQKHFNDPWVTSVEFQMRECAGNEGAVGSIHWDAPIAVTVCRTRRRGKRQAVCMSLYAAGDVLCIIQLQGFFAIDIPVPLRNWPERFVKACQELAIKNHFKEVRIAKAHSLSSYRYPDLPGAKTEAELGAATEGVRTRMLSHYDGTARELGFADRGNWFVWANSSHSLCSARSTSPKVLDPKTPFTGTLGLF